MFGQDIFCVPKNATNTIYVEGIPVDASEREVSRKCCLWCPNLPWPIGFHNKFRLLFVCHILSLLPNLALLLHFPDIFRPFKGFKSVRLIPREINPDEKVILCFADFENDF